MRPLRRRHQGGECMTRQSFEQLYQPQIWFGLSGAQLTGVPR